MSIMKNILIVGAGTRRVQADILPAIEATGMFAISGVYAQRPRNIQVGTHQYAVESLKNLQKEAVEKADWLYIGVPSASVSSVLRFISQFDTKHLGLIIDTPVFPWKYSGNKKYFKNFARVVAAEDIVYLPWINPIRKILGGEVSTLVFNRSAYRYHGIALIKTLIGTSRFTRARLKKMGEKTTLELESMGTERKAKTTIVEPRDYATGTFTLSGPKGSITDDPRVSNMPKILPVISGGMCVGLDIAGERLDFNPVQRNLIGPVSKNATVTSLTLQLKRLGLMTLFSGLAQNPAGSRKIEEALADTRLDELVHYFGRWFNVA